ncbi:MAG TPA: hypothetical protein VKJ07_19215, partial [Mycobacteriales bacterium]|nr:hypothetical protein [Mycobacteriales bacterium]
AGLRRVAWLTRATIAAAVALTGGFAAIAAQAFPGRSGQRATAVPSPVDAVAPPVADTTTEPPTTTTPTTTVLRSAAVAHRPLQPPVTAPRAVVPVHPPVTPAPAPVVHRVRPHAVSGGS